MSVSSPTDIGNLTLDLLSAGTVQDIENPSSPTEEILNRWYDLSRRKLLREHPWNFSIRRAKLAASNTAPAFGYDKQFPVPSDFLRILTINDTAYTADVPARGEAYKIEGNSILMRDIFSDSGVCNLVYVADIKSVSQFDPLFTDLLPYEIALSVAYKVSGANANVQRIAQIYKEKLAMAKAIDGQESPPRVIERSRLRHARRNNNAHSDSHRIKF